MQLRPFRGFRPKKELTASVIAPPYDVLSRQEARELARDNPYSFLRVTKPELGFPDTVSETADMIYVAGSQQFQKLCEEKKFVQDPRLAFYVLQMQLGEIRQTGIFVAANVHDYLNGHIKKHELTRADKQKDRLRHRAALKAVVSPTLLTFRAQPGVTSILQAYQKSVPDVEVTDSNAVTHRLWVVDEPTAVKALEEALAAIRELYIADGHHRVQAAADHQKECAEATDFLAVIFPEQELHILPYHRAIKKERAVSKETLMSHLSRFFTVQEHPGIFQPQQVGEYGLYLPHQWYTLSPLSIMGDDVVTTDILTHQILTPLFDISDLRQDPHIEFMGGTDAVRKIIQGVDQGELFCGLLVSATPMATLLNKADAGEMMPPKSTYFEPKLCDGLVVDVVGV